MCDHSIVVMYCCILGMRSWIKVLIATLTVDDLVVHYSNLIVTVPSQTNDDDYALPLTLSIWLAIGLAFLGGASTLLAHCVIATGQPSTLPRSKVAITCKPLASASSLGGSSLPLLLISTLIKFPGRVPYLSVK